MFGITKNKNINIQNNPVYFNSPSERQLIEFEISKFKHSKKRKDMLTGERYYRGLHDILSKQRTVIGEDGALIPVSNLPDNRLVDNQYCKMVTQKVNYLLGKPITFDTDSKDFEKLLRLIFDKNFLRTLKRVGEDAINGGIAWLYPFYDPLGSLHFKRFDPAEILPFWKDSEHTQLDMAVRIFETEQFDGHFSKNIENVEVYKVDGVYSYTLQNGRLIDNPDNYKKYIYFTGDNPQNPPFEWGRVPIIPFRSGSKEIPLINRVKTIQDAINDMLSQFQNSMQEDPRNCILILKNYDGANLAEFRHNLASYGAVKVRTVDGSDGGVEALKVDVSAQNYESIMRMLKNSMIENSMGYDAKDDRVKATSNQLNIKSMYSDIDLDANSMETEFQASFDELLWFVRMHAFHSGWGDFFDTPVQVVFNRDMLVNESEVIENACKSASILSQKTVISQHPWINDVSRELERIQSEK